jgi:hypothetical protein
MSNIEQPSPCFTAYKLPYLIMGRYFNFLREKATVLGTNSLWPYWHYVFTINS